MKGSNKMISVKDYIQYVENLKAPQKSFRTNKWIHKSIKLIQHRIYWDWREKKASKLSVD